MIVEEQEIFQTSNPILTLEGEGFDYRELPLSILWGKRDGQIFPPKLMVFAPAVICSPRKTGRTTQGNFIYKIFKNITPEVTRFEIDEHSLRSVRSEEDFRDLLIEEFESDGHGTGYFSDVIKSSGVLSRTKGIKVIFLRQLEGLPKEALNWLLHGLKKLEKDQEIADLRVQIIIDGSFAIETLTSANSRYPLPQLFPREFVFSEQKKFMASRFGRIDKAMSDDAYAKIWDATRGDKYFTQAVCMRISNSSSRFIDEDEVLTHLDEFIKEIEYKDNLKPFVHNAFFRLSEHYQGNSTRIQNILDTLDQSWSVLPVMVRKILYEGGLVRRSDSSQVAIRAPLIQRIYKETEKRVQKVKAIFRSRFALEMVRPNRVAHAAAVVRSVMEKSYSGTLKSVQVGYGFKKNASEIVVNVATLDKGQYTAVWKTSAASDVPVGSDVMCIMHAFEDKAFQVNSVLDIFPCHDKS